MTDDRPGNNDNGGFSDQNTPGGPPGPPAAPPNQPPPPAYQPPPPGSQPPPPGQPYPPSQPYPAAQPYPSAQPYPQQYAPGQFPPGPGQPPGGPVKKRRVWPWVLGGVGALFMLLVVVAVIAVAAGRDDDPVGSDEAAGQSSDDEADPGSDSDSDSGAVGSSDEVDDVAPCQFVDSDTIILDVTNNSSKQSSYFIDVNFLNAAGERVGDETFFINYLRPDERTIEEEYVIDSAGGTDCEIAEVERFLAESTDDVGEVTCEVTGLDFADDIETEFVATNGSSEVSDYLITASLVRDGIRIGTAFGSVDNVRPGQSAPSDGFSLAPGPVDGVVCDVVDVSRYSSE